MSPTGAVVACVVAVAVAAASLPILRRLPEPADDAAEDKLPYRVLATPAFAVVVGLGTLAAGLLAAWRSDVGLWLGVTTAALAVAIDARTTWLPLRLARAGWGLLALGVAWHAAATGDPLVLVRAGVGGLVGAGLMALAWRYLGMGFGDVRLMGLLTATAAAHSWALLYPTLLGGAVVGALWGVVHRLTRGPGHFPYGPGLWLGALAALALAG